MDCIPFIQKVKTTSASTAVPIGYIVRGWIVKNVHIGSTRNEAELIIQIAIDRNSKEENRLELVHELQLSLQLGNRRCSSFSLWNIYGDYTISMGLADRIIRFLEPCASCKTHADSDIGPNIFEFCPH